MDAKDARVITERRKKEAIEYEIPNLLKIIVDEANKGNDVVVLKYSISYKAFKELEAMGYSLNCTQAGDSSRSEIKW